MPGEAGRTLVLSHLPLCQGGNHRRQVEPYSFRHGSISEAPTELTLLDLVVVVLCLMGVMHGRGIDVLRLDLAFSRYNSLDVAVSSDDLISDGAA